MTIDWKKYVDQIYVVHYAGHNERLDDLYKELKRVDILDSGIFYRFDNISTPFYNELYNNFEIIALEPHVHKNGYTYAFDCTLGHYYCMKHALMNNYNRILILENDARFLKDKSKIDLILNKIYSSVFSYENNSPTLILGNASIAIEFITDKNSYYIDNINYDNNFDDFVYIDVNINNDTYDWSPGAAFNIYNTKAMELLCSIIESHKYAIIDNYVSLYKNTDLTLIISLKHIVLQQPWQLMGSNIEYNDYNMFPPSEKDMEYLKSINNYELYNKLIDYYNLSYEKIT